MPDFPNPEPIELNDQWSLDPVLRFDLDANGLPRAVVRTDHAEAIIYLHGAHVTHYQRHGEQPLLFMSVRSAFADGSPIRGGVPICFPWFGDGRAPGSPYDSAQSPSHGPARSTAWEVAGVSHEGDALDLDFRLRTHGFEILHRVSVGPVLKLSLLVTNEQKQPATFEEALHTYLAVGDAKQVSITGLEGVTYFDKTQQFAEHTQGDELIRFTGETDRIYQSTESTCTLDDPVMGRKIRISKKYSRSTVVWNPWSDRAAAIEDLGDDEWPKFVCIETANVGGEAISLPPGQTHRMDATIDTL